MTNGISLNAPHKLIVFLVCDVLNERHHSRVTYVEFRSMKGSRTIDAEGSVGGGT